MSKWLLIDGFNMLYRCFYAIPELTRMDGFPTNALHGWVRMLWKLEDAEKTNQLAVFFDLGASEKRMELFSDYKANRKAMPEALIQQIPWAKKICEAHGYPVLEKAGVEADDLIASAAVVLANRGYEAYIVSADKDLAQIVRPHIIQILPPASQGPLRIWKRLDPAGVRAKFGVDPELIPDYLALIGDSSDNIPGIPGVGRKTASRWICEYGGLEAIIEQSDAIKPERFQPLLKELAEQLRINLKLIRLDQSLDISSLDRHAPQPQKIFEALKQLEMKTALEKAHERFPSAVQEELPWFGTFFSGS